MRRGIFFRKSGRRSRRNSPLRRLIWDRSSGIITTPSGSGTTVGQVIYDPQAFDFTPIDITKLFAGCRLILNYRSNFGVGVADSSPIIRCAVVIADAAATTPQIGAGIPSQVDFLDYWHVLLGRPTATAAAGFHHDDTGANPPEVYDRKIRVKRVVRADERIVLCVALTYLNGAPIDTNFIAEVNWVVSNLTKARELKV